MKVYITYDRYEHDEWFNVFQITDSLDEVRKDYKKNLIDFISYGPDDCHSYQIQVVDMGKADYDHLKELILNQEDTIEDGELYNIMVNIYNDCRWTHYPNSNCLLSTDGCSDNVDVVKFYMEENGLDPEDDDLYYENEEELFDNNALYQEMLAKYIDTTYQI